jgi:class 3 adenylate cyclase
MRAPSAVPRTPRRRNSAATAAHLWLPVSRAISSTVTAVPGIGGAGSAISLVAEPGSGEFPEGERKTVTALFADIKGSMELMEDLDPEEARAIIDDRGGG